MKKYLICIPLISAGLGPWIAALLAPGRSHFLLDHSHTDPTSSGQCPIDAVQAPCCMRLLDGP